MKIAEPLRMQPLRGQGGDHSESWDWARFQPLPRPWGRLEAFQASKLPSLSWRELDPPHSVVGKPGIGKASSTHLQVAGAASPAVAECGIVVGRCGNFYPKAVSLLHLET